MTTLRNVIGGMALEKTLTSRDEINGQLRGVLDEATGKWGIRVNRVELKAIDPPPSIQDSMEKQMRADRDKRATILAAEGVKQSQILTAEGEKERDPARRGAETGGDPCRRRVSRRRSTRSSARSTRATPTRSCSPTQYLQVLPQIAQGDSNKVWIIPSEVTQALGRLTDRLPGRDERQES